MCSIWACSSDISAAHIVKIQNQLPVPSPCSWCGHIFDVVSFPKTIAITKGFQSTFSTNASAGEHNKFLFPHESKILGISFVHFCEQPFFIANRCDRGLH